MIVAFDKYTNGTDELQAMIRRVDDAIKTVVLGDDSFFSHGALSLYDYFLYGQEVHEEKKLHYNFLNVPEFWEVRAVGGHGAVYDMGCQKATIDFIDTGAPCVRRVEWRAEDGWVYKIDYYNKYALKYASDFLDADGNVESRVFYSSRNQEVIVEQPQNSVITLLESGRVSAFFYSYGEFIDYFFKKTGLKEKRILFVQEQDGLKLADLRAGGASMWEYVFFQSGELLNRYIDRGGINGYRFYSIPEEYPVNGARGEALTLTCSDRLEGIEYLIHELPEVMFHIAANTQVSDKLHRLSECQNAKVYPQISAQDLNALWDRCDFYLDINRYSEIHNAIDTAHKRNLLILGFEDTVHCRKLVAEEDIYAPSDEGRIVSELRELVGHPELVERRLANQQAKRREIWKEFQFMIQWD